MSQQSQAEGGGSRRIRLQRPRRQGRDLPAGRGRARLRHYRGAQHERGRARAFRRQGQAPARGQIEAPRRAPGLDQHRPQRRAASGLRPGPQHALGITRPHQQDSGGIEPEFGQPRRVQPAGLGIDDILPHPKDRALLRGPDGEADGESRRRREIGRGGRIDLMQGGPGDAAAQRLIEGGRAETHLPHRRRRATQRHLGEMAAQFGQRSGVRAGLHAGSCSVFVLL